MKPKPITNINKNLEVINMPRLSDTMEEGTVATWNKKVGDLVEEGDILAEIETDKATMEFESFYSGHLIHIGLEEGQSAPVDAILAVIGDKDTDKEVKALIEFCDTISVKESSNTTKKEESLKEKPKESEKPIKNIKSEIINNDRDHSPLAKKIATEKGGIIMINGSGDNGRIIKRDIENFNSSNIVSKENSTLNREESLSEFANSQMRKAIAKRLSQSKFSAPHYYLGVEFDMENLISFRIQHNNSTDSKISFNDLIIKASAKALKLHPEVNSRWYDEKIVHFNHVHVGVAVAVDEDGLVVPVVKFTDELKLPQIGGIVKDYAIRARDKKLVPAEMDGSTFTISNNVWNSRIYIYY